MYTRIASSLDWMGTIASYTLTTEDRGALKPASFSFEEAAAVPLAAMTALQMLRKAEFKAGDSILINAAAGGVGHYAGQIAKALGASKVTGNASAPKHDLLRSLGFDNLIDYKNQSYVVSIICFQTL